jgi:hypothetical protein
MKKQKLVTAAALAIMVALTACGQQAITPRAPAPAQASVPAPAPAAPANAQAPAADDVAVFGALNDADWYMVVKGKDAVKPIVIQAESKSACELNVAEFSLKSITPHEGAVPAAARCLVGRDVRSQLGV